MQIKQSQVKHDIINGNVKGHNHRCFHCHCCYVLQNPGYAIVCHFLMRENSLNITRNVCWRDVLAYVCPDIQ